QNAAGTLSNLVNVATGAASPVLVNPINSPTKLNAFANLLATCVDSLGPASPECSSLFGSSPAADGTVPQETMASAFNIARNPAQNVGGLSNAATTNSNYAPSITQPPTHWAMTINYSGGGLSEPTAIALDAAGNVWVANYNNRVSKFSPIGVPISSGNGYRGGGLRESFGLAVDISGNVWETNEEGSSAHGGKGCITNLNSAGQILSRTHGYVGGGLNFPVAITTDTTGNAWAANFGNSSLTKFGPSGAPLSPVKGFYGGGVDFPVGLGIGASNDVWAANQGSNTITHLLRT